MIFPRNWRSLSFKSAVSKNFEAYLGVDECLQKCRVYLMRKVFCLFSCMEVIGSSVCGDETLLCNN